MKVTVYLVTDGERWCLAGTEQDSNILEDWNLLDDFDQGVPQYKFTVDVPVGDMDPIKDLGELAVEA